MISEDRELHWPRAHIPSGSPPIMACRGPRHPGPPGPGPGASHCHARAQSAETHVSERCSGLLNGTGPRDRTGVPGAYRQLRISLY
eukprot:764089-Hanusia_phi.AAC.5